MSDQGRASSASLPARAVFFGSGEFGVPVLRSLADISAIEVAGVVTLPDRPVGRRATLTPTPVAAAADALGLLSLRLSSVRSDASLARIAALRPDVGILADFGRIIPLALLALPPHGIINVHPSLLPRHRGATPIPATILAGDAVAGVSVILMDEGLDTGPLLAAVSWPLRGDETTPELEARAAAVGSETLASVVPAWLAGTLVPTPQTEAGASLTRPFTKQDGRLEPALGAVRLERMVRALQPWPGTFMETGTGRLAVLQARVGEGQPGDEAGRLLADGDGLALATAEGRLRLLRVKPSGGRPMGIEDFRRGAGRDLVGTSVG